MKNNSIYKTFLLSMVITFIVVTIAFGSFYTYWNSAPPDRTCGGCHEIGKSVNSLAQSSHRDFKCKECHGTALSNGIHSMKEKGIMVLSHVKDEHVENIRPKESQLLDILKNCKRCHANEYADWTSGGHSVDYQHIFLNEKHNTTEQINFDCLRCHGMFYEGTVNELVAPLSIKGPWQLKDEKKAADPAIPCMACHQIHQLGMPAMRPDYASPKAIFYEQKDTFSVVSFYDRHEKTHYPIAELPKLKLWQGEQMVKVSDDQVIRICIQCHAPNKAHQAGTSDDRTPRGVHEGLSCNDCHELHSNSAKNSCKTCHPAISNCNLDVMKMNTSYADAKSPNNIHFVACTDCHTKEKLEGLKRIDKQNKNDL